MTLIAAILVQEQAAKNQRQRDLETERRRIKNLLQAIRAELTIREFTASASHYTAAPHHNLQPRFHRHTWPTVVELPVMDATPWFQSEWYAIIQLISVPGTLLGLILAYWEMKAKEQIERDRQDLAEQKRLADQKTKDLANEMVTTLILIKKFDGLTDDARATIDDRITSFRNEAEHGTRYPQT
jgi:hypothetical protein